MSLIVISSERFAEHQTPPGHPERSERAETMSRAAHAWQAGGGEVVAPRTATREQLARVHGAEHLRRIGETAGVAVALDPDTYTSPETHEIALLAAGAAVDAVERCLGDPDDHVLALVRPPGHHAERGRAMGFCFYNNVAVAAAHARAMGVGRVAVVDFDVHHGNGTQDIFYDDPTVLYASVHQFPYYPGTGAADEVGTGKGTGFTVNLPLEVGAVNDDYQTVFHEILLPVLIQFRPDLILVSAGFDAHEHDPLGGMRVTAPAFGAMTMDLRRVAAECCAGRIVAVTEGGYDLQALADSIDATMAALSAEDLQSSVWPAPSEVAPRRGRESAAAAKAALSRYWTL